MKDRIGRSIALLGLGAMLVTAPAWAQAGRSAVGPAIGYVSFGLEHADASVAFSFEDVVYGLSFTRAGLSATLLRGNSTTEGVSGPDDVDFFDLSLGITGSVFDQIVQGLPVYFPVMLHSTYRRVRRAQDRTDFTAFEYTGLGLGAGLGARSEGAVWGLDARVVPGIGFASRSFGNSTGRTLMLDGDLQASTDELLQGLGVSLGYNFRWQSWLVGGPDAFDVAGGGRFTYDGTAHTVRVGINW